MSADLGFDLDETALRRYLHDPGGDVFGWVRRLTDRVRDRARLYCPVRTGRLRNSIESRVGAQGEMLTGTVGSPLMYARAVHNQPCGRPFLRDGMVEAAREVGIG